ncbi:MAG: porin [Candidatus Scalindua sp.]|nr:porin [Candidatus Scalindua sp.]
MSKMKFYLLLPMIAVMAFGSVSFAQSIDAELRAELKAELKAELLAELKSETKADIQEATVGLRDVLRADFKDEIRTEIMQEDISSAVDDAIAGSAIMGGLFKGTTVTGFIDTNYMYNLRNSGNNATNRNANSYVNFVGENEDNSFTLENFAMFMDKEATDDHPIGWQMHTYWGEKTQGITFFGPGNDNAAADGARAQDRFSIAAANITWNAPVLGKTVPITMGKMYTWIGYELVENIGNPNYTHGMVYNNAIPFTHTGASFDVSEFLPSDKWGLTLYVVNGWDSYIDNNEGKSFGAYLTYTPNDDFFISFATINGPETSQDGTAGFGGVKSDGTTANSSSNVFMYDVVMTYSLPQIDKLSLGFNWDHGRAKNNSATGNSAHWWGAVAYLMYDFTDNQQGAFRYEYFDDQDGAKGFGHSMWSTTYTHNITVADNLLLRPEIRHNKYNQDDVLTYGNRGDLTAESETILAMGVEYVF